MSDATLLDQTKTTLRRTRLAYMGALGYGYDFAVARAEKRRAQVKALFAAAVERGETIETEAVQLFERAKDEVGDAATDVVSELEDTVEEAKETLQEIKEEIVEAAERAEQRAELVETIKHSETYGFYIEKVRAYDAAVDSVAVKAIVDHLGASLGNRDTKFVACSDESERRTVARNWLRKTLGVKGDAKALDAKVMSVCETMKADRLKDRVVFYYLAAKAEGKLGDL